MKFIDTIVNKEEFYSVGLEEISGKYYISIPVSNSMVDYEEYYEISKCEFEQFTIDMLSAIPLVEKCRARENDDRLIMQPGSNRGVPRYPSNIPGELP